MENEKDVPCNRNYLNEEHQSETNCIDKHFESNSNVTNGFWNYLENNTSESTENNSFTRVCKSGVFFYKLRCHRED